MKKNNKGFTIVELIIVIAILIIIAGIFSLNMVATMHKQRDEENKNVVAQIISAANTYVSVNPEQVKNLYEGYGYVDIPVGELRDAGLLSEDLIDKDTGEKIPDTEKVRVKLDIEDTMEFTYPADNPVDAWRFTADNLNVPYDETGSVEKWCSIDANNPLLSNVYKGLIVNPSEDYTSIKSKIYALDKNAHMYTGGSEGYFKEFNLSVESCDINPSKVGTYSVTYKYTDPELGSEKTFKRVVYVDSDSKDVISFAAEINGGTPIVRGTRRDLIPIRIVETYRDGTKTIDTYIGKLGTIGIEYEIDDFDTDKVIVKDATVNRTKQNSDGSLAITQKVKYEVIPDVYDLTYDIGYTLNRRESSFPDRVQKYNSDVAWLRNKKPIKFQYTYSDWTAIPSNNYNSYGDDLAIPNRRGYTFNYWELVPSTCMTTYPNPDGVKTKTNTLQSSAVYNTTLMNNLCNHTVKAKWTPNTYTVYFNANSSGVYLNQTSKSVTYDATYGTLPTPSKTGYSFLGWFTSPSGGTQITSSTEVDIIANQNLYAHWRPNNYTVSFSGGSVYPSSKVVTFDSSYGVLPTPYRSGYSNTYSSGGGCSTTVYYSYSFNGYYLNGSYISPSTIVKTPSNHTLSASFSSYSTGSSTYCPPPPDPPKPTVDSKPAITSKPVQKEPEPPKTPPCQVSCTNACGTSSTAHSDAAKQCQVQWVVDGCKNINTQPHCAALHDSAMSHRDIAQGGSGQGCTAYYCPDSGNTFGDGGKTKDKNGNVISISGKEAEALIKK